MSLINSTKIWEKNLIKKAYKQLVFQIAILISNLNYFWWIYIIVKL